MPVNATTLARVKDRLKKTNVADTADDALLQILIDGTSREFERHLGFELEQKSRIEKYSPEVGDQLVFLKQRPVVSIAQVRVAAEGTWDFALYTTLVANRDYRLIAASELYFVSGLIYGKDTLEVTYVAGLGVDTAALITAAPDVALAADIQVTEDFRRKDTATASQRDGKSFSSEMTLLPRVIQILSMRRRLILA